MKQFMHLTTPRGLVYEIPTEIIAQHRAKIMRELHPSEFPDDASAMEDTRELFDDEYQIQDWAANNMNWPELGKHARLIRLLPSTDAWHEGEWTSHDTPALLGDVDGETIMSNPLELSINVMAASGQACNVTLLHDDNSQPYAAVAVMVGPNPVLSQYVQALQFVTGRLPPAGEPAPAPIQ